MRRQEKPLSMDKLADDINEMRTALVEESTTYFRILFGSDDELDDALSIFIHEGAPTLQLMKKKFNYGNPELELPSELNPTLRDWLSRPCLGKPTSKIMMACKYSLLLSCAFSAACLRSLEAGEKSKAISAYGKCQFYVGTCIATGRAEFGESSVSTNVLLGAKAKLAADPKQKEKALVRDCWNDWQKHPGRYKGKAAFAKDMLSKFESLENANVITRWCLMWQKEHGTQQAQ